MTTIRNFVMLLYYIIVIIQCNFDVRDTFARSLKNPYTPEPEYMLGNAFILVENVLDQPPCLLYPVCTIHGLDFISFCHCSMLIACIHGDNTCVRASQCQFLCLFISFHCTLLKYWKYLCLKTIRTSFVWILEVIQVCMLLRIMEKWLRFISSGTMNYEHVGVIWMRWVFIWSSANSGSVKLKEMFWSKKCMNVRSMNWSKHEFWAPVSNP